MITAEARAKAAAARAAAHRNIPRTTRPGSESTILAVGDRVKVDKSVRRFGGRTGTVTTIHRQAFPADAGTYIEIGIHFGDVKPGNLARAEADAWFRDDELIRVTS